MEEIEGLERELLVRELLVADVASTIERLRVAAQVLAVITAIVDSLQKKKEEESRASQGS